jgi:lipocalin
MARTPQISDADYEKLTALIKSWDYDMTKLVKSPQQAPEQRKK